MALLSSHGREIGPEDPLKGQSRSLSRVVSVNPWFRRLVMVISGSFSGCLWEVMNTGELGGASQHSTGFAAINEGLI